MKKHLLLTFIFSNILLSSFTQNKWAEYTTTFAGPHYTVYEACGDTIVDGNEYQKIIKSDYFISDSSKFNSSLFAITREIGDQIFYRFGYNGPNDTTDHLLYDYGIQVGDTITLQTFYGGTKDFKVTHVDTILLLNKNRRQIRIENIPNSYEDIWVEEIGSIQRGYFSRGNPINIIDAGSDFSCFYSADLDSIWSSSIVYPCIIDQFELSCGETTALIKNSLKLNIKVFPSPFSDFVELEQLPLQGTIFIYNLFGQSLGNWEIENNHFRIETGGFEAGVYVIKVQDRDGTKAIKKVVKLD